jgi:hypothetical protein
MLRGLSHTAASLILLACFHWGRARLAQPTCRSTAPLTLTRLLDFASVPVDSRRQQRIPVSKYPRDSPAEGTGFLGRLAEHWARISGRCRGPQLRARCCCARSPCRLPGRHFDPRLQDARTGAGRALGADPPAAVRAGTEPGPAPPGLRPAGAGDRGFRSLRASCRAAEARRLAGWSPCHGRGSAGNSARRKLNSESC